jgi:hypothetical protein
MGREMRNFLLGLLKIILITALVVVISCGLPPYVVDG